MGSRNSKVAPEVLVVNGGAIEQQPVPCRQAAVKPSPQSSSPTADSTKPVVVEDPYCLVCIGNPGSGKSTLLNSIIGEAKFASGFSAGKGLTSEMLRCKHKGVTYIDTPGLADTQMREQAALVITEALGQGCPYQLLFLVTLEGSHTRPQDKATVQLVLESLAASTESSQDFYGVVVNKVPACKINGASSEKNDFETQFFKGMAPTKHICWLEETDIEDKDDQLLQLPSRFMTFLSKLPKITIKKDLLIPVQWNKFEKLQQEYTQQIQELEKEYEKLWRLVKGGKKGDAKKNKEKKKDKGASQADAKPVDYKDADEVVVLQDIRIAMLDENSDEEGSGAPDDSPREREQVFQCGSHGKVVDVQLKNEGGKCEALTVDFGADAGGVVTLQRHHLVDSICLASDVERIKRNKVRDLAHRGLSLGIVLDFYGKLIGAGDEMPPMDFDPHSSTTADVVMNAVLPMTQKTGLSFAEQVNREPKRATRMVSHNWRNLFSHLVAALVADALDEPSYARVIRDFDNFSKKGIAKLKLALQEGGRLDIQYWVCAFSVNQHMSICKAQCNCPCHRTNLPNSSPLCEMDKFDDMMAYLFDRGTDNSHEAEDEADVVNVVRHVVAVDVRSVVFSRAWVIAELVVALCLQCEVTQKYRVFDETALKLLSESKEGKGIRIEDCEASRPQDKEFVLTKANALIAKQDMDSDLFHEKLNRNIFEVLQATSKAAEKRSMPHVLCIGNAGVGKSTILNQLMGKQVFPKPAGKVELLCECEHNGTVFMEALGLAEMGLRSKTAKAITEALRRGGDYKIFFVITLESGRVRPEDQDLMMRVLEAAPIGSSYSVLINKARHGTVRRFANPKTRRAIERELFRALPQPLVASDFVSWVAMDAQTVHLPPGLLDDAPQLRLERCTVQKVDGTTPEQVAARLEAKKAQLEQDNAALMQALKQDWRHFGGGASRYNDNYHCTVHDSRMKKVGDEAFEVQLDFTVVGDGSLGPLQDPKQSRLMFEVNGSQSRGDFVELILDRKQVGGRSAPSLITGTLVWTCKLDNVNDIQVFECLWFTFGSSGYSAARLG